MTNPIKSPLEKLGKQPQYTHSPEVQKFIEFSRYKQDCRKRALEMAANKFVGHYDIVGDNAVIVEADKYYNWLISIPEK